MADFSIRKVSVNPDISTNSNKATPFAKAKEEYLAKAKKMEASDFANSPVALNDRLEDLKNLKELASKENLEKESSWIEEEISSVNEKLNEKSTTTNDVPFYKPILTKENAE